MNKAKQIVINKQTRAGFTIVELLIVIVVIGILAAIAIVSFSGIRQRATDTVVRNDLAESAKILSNDQTINSNYPATTSAANGGKGLPYSGGTIYTYTVNNSGNPQTYTLTANNPSSSNTYGITNFNSTPSLVTATMPVISSPASNTNYNTDGCGPAPGYYSFYIYSTGTGSPTPTIQWQRMTPTNTTTGTWVDISGATNSYLNFNGTGIMADGSYDMFRVKYTNAAGTTTSPLWTVNVTNGC